LSFVEPGLRKVLYRALSGVRYSPSQLHVAVDWLVAESKLELVDKVDNDHEFDALLSAWATREGYSRGWQDLLRTNPITSSRLKRQLSLAIIGA
jgi:hypothetical protein